MKDFLEGYKKLTLHTIAYPVEAVTNACYSFIDNYYFFLDIPGKTPHKIVVYFKPKKTTHLKKTGFVNEFRDALLYAVLRLQLAKNNKRLREYIVGSALYSNLMPSGQEGFLTGIDNGKMDDPLGIGVPWEEKYASKKNRSRS